MMWSALHLSSLCNEVVMTFSFRLVLADLSSGLLKFQMSLVTTCKLKIQQDKKY